jgi:hypothetical protein
MPGGLLCLQCMGTHRAGVAKWLLQSTRMTAHDCDTDHHSSWRFWRGETSKGQRSQRIKV